MLCAQFVSMFTRCVHCVYVCIHIVCLSIIKSNYYFINNLPHCYWVSKTKRFIDFRENFVCLMTKKKNVCDYNSMCAIKMKWVEIKENIIYIVDVISMLPTHVTQTNSHPPDPDRSTNPATVKHADSLLFMNFYFFGIFSPFQTSV